MYKDHIWHKQAFEKDFEFIEVKECDLFKDFRRDPTGFYTLIRINFALLRIEVAICNKDHKIIKVFRGRNAQDLYHAIFVYEKRHRVQWFTEKTHIAYLGKELKKAELALVLGNNAYFQE